jgi:hypothetical protein
MTAASYTSRSFAPAVRSTLRLRRLIAALGVCLPVPICAASGLTLPLPATVERIAAALVPFTDAVAMSANEALRPGAAGSIVPKANERGGERTEVSAVQEVIVRGRSSKNRVRVVVPRSTVASRRMPGEALLVAFAPLAEFASAAAARAASAARSETEQVYAGGQPSPTAGPEPAPLPGPSPVTDKQAPAPSGATTPSQPEPQSAPPEPQPAPPPTRNDPDPVAPVKEVVNDVTAPVAPVVETTSKTVEETVAPVKETVAPVTELLPGLGK